MDVRDRFNEISLNLNLESAVSFNAWSSYEKTRKVFCLEVRAVAGVQGKTPRSRQIDENKYVSHVSRETWALSRSHSHV